MAKTTKTPPRKTVKARGALPSPRVAPQRDTTPWHGKIGPRIGMALAAIALIAFIVVTILNARERAEARRQDVRAVEQFERRVADLNSKIEPVLQGLSQAPGAFLAGALPVEEYRTQAESWVTTFRDLNQGIKNLEADPEIEGLVEAKAHYVQGTMIYLDAAKIFVAAAAITDPAEREKTTVLGRNTFLHGTYIYAFGDRDITKLKNEYELNDPPVDPQPPTLPEEEIEIQPPPAPEAPPADPAAPAEPPAAPPAPAAP
jgi:hypothetical protein